MFLAPLARNALALTARSCLSWSAIEAWLEGRPRVSLVDLTVIRRPHRPIEVVLVGRDRDGVEAVRRRWRAQTLGTDLTERLAGASRLRVALGARDE